MLERITREARGDWKRKNGKCETVEKWLWKTQYWKTRDEKWGTGKSDDVHYGKPPKRTNLSVSDLCVLELSVSVSSNLCVFFCRWNICFEISRCRPIVEPPFSLSWDSLSKPESEKTKHLQVLILCNCWSPSRLWRVEIAIREPIFNLGFRDWEISDPGIQAGLRNLPLYYTYECKKRNFYCTGMHRGTSVLSCCMNLKHALLKKL